MNYNHKKVEKEINKHWNNIDLLSKLKRKNKGGKPYILLEGPPYANAELHVGHLRNIFFKDLSIRYEFMKGKDVLFTAGFDTHGLPIEHQVEKKLNIKNKKDIFKFGVKKFSNECKKLATKSISENMKIYDKYGTWFATDKDPYLTYSNDYLESSWWAFKQIWNRGMVYKGRKPVHWCPRCSTACAGYEVTDSYQNLSDPAVYVKFKIKDSDESVLVYTTTPWTLPSNVALAVKGDADYVTISVNNEKIILAESRLELMDKFKFKYKILSKYKGKKLEGLEYLPLFDTKTQKRLDGVKQARKIYLSQPMLKERLSPKAAEKLGLKSGEVYEDFVSVESGTGILHTAPGHGKSDNIFGNLHNLPEISPIDESGNFNSEVEEYSGMFYKDADNKIIEYLKRTNALMYTEKINHSVAVCWRCKTPLVYMLSNQWFFNTNKIIKKLLSENKKINWMPEFARDRMHTWLSNYDDWNFTRQRFWGIPVPIFECKSCKNNLVIESKKDLEKQMKKKLPENFDLHELNTVKIPCSCGSNLKSIGDIFDVWYDSGMAPWAWLGYPHKNKKIFEKHFPVDKISEGTDQIRGWFFSLLYTSVAVFNKAPYKTVTMPAFAVDTKGEKMSKSVGNVVWAKDGINDLGADLIRLYYCTNAPGYELAKFNSNEIKKETFSVINTLWNLANYLKTEYPIVTSQRLTKSEDKWLISRANSMIKEYESAYQNFEYQNMGRAISNFVINDLSRTYVQYVRNRNDQKIGYVLLESLLTTLKLLAPIAPFVSDKIYLMLKDYPQVSQKSIHLERIPSPDKYRIDKKLESKYELFNSIISEILANRERIKRNLRWPIKSINISTKESKFLKDNLNLLKDQTNILEINFLKNIEGSKIEYLPNYKLIGSKYGKDTRKIVDHITKLDIENPNLNMKLNGKDIKLNKSLYNEMRLLPDGSIGSANKDYIFTIDTEESESMIKSGFTREVIRKVQDERKIKGYKKNQKINLKIFSEVDLDLNEIQNKVNSKTIELVSKSNKNLEFFVRGKRFSVSL